MSEEEKEPISLFHKETASEAATSLQEASLFQDTDTNISSQECSDETSTTQISTMPKDLSAIDEPPSQHEMTAFPYTKFAVKNRCFSQKWYNEFTRLEYSSTNNAVFCKACRHFPDPCADKSFICDGFKDWKHLRRSRIRHQASKSHSLSLCKYEAYKAARTQGTVLNQLFQGDQTFVEKNREHMKVVIDIVMFCGKQGIALRGHRVNEKALNKGSFLELFSLIAWPKA